MKKQFTFIVTCALGITSASVKAIDGKSVLAGAAESEVTEGVIPFVPPYITHRVNAYVLFEQGLEVKNEVVGDLLFFCRNSDSAHIIEFMYDHKYSFMEAVNRLFELLKKVEYAVMYINMASEKYPLVDGKIKHDCETLLHELEQLSSELKLFAKRLMCTKQWAREVGLGTCY